jgi:hypothetical protein
MEKAILAKITETCPHLIDSKMYQTGFKDGKSKDLNSNLWSLIMRNKFKDQWNVEKKVDITSGGEKIDSPKKIEIEIIKNKLDDEK